MNGGLMTVRWFADDKLVSEETSPYSGPETINLISSEMLVRAAGRWRRNEVTLRAEFSFDPPLVPVNFE